MNNMYDLLINTDLSPKLIGKFSNKTKFVKIEIFDQHNNQINIDNNDCFQISNTNRWVWSINNIREKISNKLIYKMVSDSGEIFIGDFEGGK